ncbi:MAG: chemotaxis protein CheX [Deltaproteobacteria bacterium]|nr:chemotaxis protein CheX [Deltaproteobacteria bacterium]
MRSEIATEYLREQLRSAFDRVWRTTLELELEEFFPNESDVLALPWLGSVAWIGGSWTGNVRIGMPRELASSVTGKLLSLEKPSDAQILDALRELSNMTAGNLKSALPGRCGLATPGNFTVRSIAEVRDEFSPIMISWYRSSGFPLFLTISALHPAAVEGEGVTPPHRPQDPE